MFVDIFQFVDFVTYFTVTVGEKTFFFFKNLIYTCSFLLYRSFINATHSFIFPVCWRSSNPFGVPAKFNRLSISELSHTSLKWNYQKLNFSTRRKTSWATKRNTKLVWVLTFPRLEWNPAVFRQTLILPQLGILVRVPEKIRTKRFSTSLLKFM